ncbi:MAG: methyltransferase domain-containing protein [bacterium]|nr:methyltransferase domain-containing protein [bacterium]
MVFKKEFMNSVGKNNEFERIRWLKKTLKDLKPGLRILDAGAGEQKFKPFCAHLDYVSQDFGQYDGKGNTKGLQTGTWDQSKINIVSDISSIPEPNGSFDVIMCIEVFEHLPDPLLAIKEFHRLLKNGGLLIITAPFCSLTHYAPYHYTSGFNSYYYERHLHDTGFEHLEIEANGNFFEFIAQEVRRIPAVADTYCKGRINIFEKVLLILILKLLEKFSKKDMGSSELLCFGYHIHARKLCSEAFKE